MYMRIRFVPHTEYRASFLIVRIVQFFVDFSCWPPG